MYQKHSNDYCARFTIAINSHLMIVVFRFIPYICIHKTFEYYINISQLKSLYKLCQKTKYF